MAKSPSQLRSMIRQAQQKQRQAIDKINRELRARSQRVNQAVRNYNQQVTAYNARLRANRDRLVRELARLSRPTTSSRQVTLRVSFNSVHRAYERLERAADAGQLDQRYSEILDLSEREAANSAGLVNAFEGDAEQTSGAAPDEPASPVTPFLEIISSELADRWRGALYSLSPRNPDAARHFCTSAREIIARILQTKAPDDAVAAAAPDCDRTPQGPPTRRAKLRYLLQARGLDQADLEAFVESDISNVVELFEVFNSGTHGTAGAIKLTQLQALRKRVEDGIAFLSHLVR